MDVPSPFIEHKHRFQFTLGGMHYGRLGGNGYDLEKLVLLLHKAYLRMCEERGGM